MKFNDLPRLDLAAIDIYRERFAQSDTELADAAPNSRFAWNQGYNYHYLDDGNLLTAVSDGGCFSRPHFCLPLGKLNAEALEPVFSQMAQLFANEGWYLCSMFVEAKHKPVYDQVADRLGYFIEWDYNEDYDDYVYSGDKLRTLSGRRYRSKRNHINQFLRNYPDIEYRPISKDLADQALDLVRAWAEDREVDPHNLRDSDYLPIKFLFDNFDKLDIRGGAIFLNDLLLAFAMGSQTYPDKAVIHFEKANPKFDNIYAVINRWVAEEAFPDAVEINREEDMGIEGMRMAKESYYPIAKLRKYRAHFLRK